MTGKKNPGGDIIALLRLLAVMDAMKQSEAIASGIGIRTASEDAGADAGQTGIGIRPLMGSDKMDQSHIDKLSAIFFGGPCDCEICQDGRKAQRTSANTGAASDQASAEAQTATNVRSVDAQVAALAGLTPSMLEDEPDAPATRMRMATAEFITALRTSYAGKIETSPAHRTIGASVELSLMNALDTALAGLDD